MKHQLACDGIYLEFGSFTVLKSIYLKCETGEVVGLLGRNGSGKSSLMKIVFGSLPASSKSVRIDGIVQLKPFSGKMSYLPQDNFIPPFLTIRNALKVCAIRPGVLIDLFPEINEVLDYTPSQTSGGISRIIEVLLILNLPSQFCLLDEPFSGIMPVHAETLIKYMNIKKQERGILITDHLYRYITAHADRLYVLSNGQTYPVEHQNQLIELGYLNVS